MRTTWMTMVIGMAAVGLTAGTARATDEPPTIHQRGTGRARVETGRLAKFVMKRPLSEVYDLPDVPDNDPTVEGGTLRFYELGNPGNSDTFPLQASGWSKRGADPLSPTAFLYRGAGIAGDPCRFVKLTRSAVKGLCLGSEVTLAPPLANPFLAVTLTVGTSSKQYCPAYVALTNEPGRLRGTPAIVGQDELCSPSAAFLDAD